MTLQQLLDTLDCWITLARDNNYVAIYADVESLKAAKEQLYRLQEIDRLDQAWKDLMEATVEPDEPTDADIEPILRYRYPK